MLQATALQRLSFKGCLAGNACMMLAPLSRMQSLEDFEITGARVSDSALAALSRGLHHTPRMTHLYLMMHPEDDIDGAQRSTRACWEPHTLVGLWQAWGGLSQLQSLNLLSDMVAISRSEECFAHLAKLSNLRQLWSRMPLPDHLQSALAEPLLQLNKLTCLRLSPSSRYLSATGPLQLMATIGRHGGILKLALISEERGHTRAVWPGLLELGKCTQFQDLSLLGFGTLRGAEVQVLVDVVSPMSHLTALSVKEMCDYGAILKLTEAASQLPNLKVYDVRPRGCLDGSQFETLCPPLLKMTSLHTLGAPIVYEQDNSESDVSDEEGGGAEPELKCRLTSRLRDHSMLKCIYYIDLDRIEWIGGVCSHRYLN